VSLDLRRLTVADAPALRALRIEAFTLHPRDFRSSPEDEAAQPLATLETLLARDHFVGFFDGETLVGAAGLIIEPRAKLAHKGLIASVYLRASHPLWATTRRCGSISGSGSRSGPLNRGR